MGVSGQRHAPAQTTGTPLFSHFGLKIEVMCSSETVVNNKKPTRHNNLSIRWKRAVGFVHQAISSVEKDK
jgi:hypothetical protein